MYKGEKRKKKTKVWLEIIYLDPEQIFLPAVKITLNKRELK